jgi:hypothetical protein
LDVGAFIVGFEAMKTKGRGRVSGDGKKSQPKAKALEQPTDIE